MSGVSNQERKAQAEWDTTFAISADEFVRSYCALLDELKQRNFSLRCVGRRLHTQRSNLYRWMRKAPANLLLRRAILTTLNRLVIR